MTDPQADSTQIVVLSVGGDVTAEQLDNLATVINDASDEVGLDAPVVLCREPVTAVEKSELREMLSDIASE